MHEDLPFELGRYRLTEMLGSGAMGVVYKGVDPLIGRPVAVKLVRTELLADAARIDYRQRLRREVQSAGCCIHPGIVTIYDYAERDGDPYIVMEYVEGQPLNLVLKQTPLPMDQAIPMTLQILAALGHAHERGVVHLDIKPSNILVGPRANLKIADFGIARMDSGTHTNAGMLLGTPNYMAPERARGERTDRRADLFAVGVILYRMITGTLPYGEADAAAVLHRTAGPDPIDLGELTLHAPTLAPVMALALAKDPTARVPTAEAFAEMLRAIRPSRADEEIWPLAPHEIAAARRQSGPVQGAWPEAILAELQTALAAAIGPIAAVLVPRTARDCQDAAELGAALARLVQNTAARERFAAQARGILERPAPPVPSPAAPSDESGLAIPASTLAAAPALLARFIGPIARILVRQSSLEVTTLDELGDRLAAHITHPVDREAFRRAFDAEFMRGKAG